MHILICYDPDALDLDRALALVSPQRRQQAMAIKPLAVRRQSLTAYLLLRLALRDVYGISTMPLLDYGVSGKPCLADAPHVHFNLSHCTQAVACVVDDNPVGVDVERDNRYREALARYVCSDSEMRDILGSSNPAVTFAALWTRKEATAKLTGRGIGDDLKTLVNPGVRYLTKHVPEHGCVYTVASYMPIGDAAVRTISSGQLIRSF